MTRVLISEFDSIVGLGICEVLRDVGCEVITRGGELTANLVRQVEPDALVVDMDDTPVVERARELLPTFPGIPFVECSPADSQMRVYPAHRFGDSYLTPLSPELLVEAVTKI